MKVGQVKYLQTFYDGSSQSITELQDDTTELTSTIQAGGSITASANTLQNVSGLNPGASLNQPFLISALDTDVQSSSTQVVLPDTNFELSISTSNSAVTLPSNEFTITIPTNKYGLYRATADLSHDYLIESNPAFTDIKQFTSSTYFLEKLDYRADKIIKRLGDAAYETEMVKRSILNQTGRQILSNTYMTANEQFIKLMDSAVNMAGI